MLHALQKKLTTLFIKPCLSRYLKKERTTRIRGFGLLVKPSVFHPKFFFSSLCLFDFINAQDLGKKTFLEIGCGSGLISLLAHRKNARVTCTDINPLAVECTRINFSKNFGTDLSGFKCIESNLFENLPPACYDVIVVNPPYFFEEAANSNQYAWNCGKNGDYFSTLFSGIKNYMDAGTRFFMILADNCDLERIREMAGQSGLDFGLAEKKKIKWETNFIFRIRPATSFPPDHNAGRP